MNAHPNPELTADLAAAFNWWREAGVDCAFHDAPADWLDKPPPPTAADSGPNAASRSPSRQRPAMPAAPTLDLAAMPDALEGFVGWWLSDPMLDGGRTSGRVPPRGSAGAETMVIVPEPERDDNARLLSGPHGRLLDAMLNIMGIEPDAAYVASAIPRHMPMADWSALAAMGIGSVLLRHVRLAAPKRLLVFGGNVLPLLGNDPTLSDQNKPTINHEGLSIPLFAATDLALMLARPRMKARVWRQWLDWTGNG